MRLYWDACSLICAIGDAGLAKWLSLNVEVP